MIHILKIIIEVYLILIIQEPVQDSESPFFDIITEKIIIQISCHFMLIFKFLFLSMINIESFLILHVNMHLFTLARKVIHHRLDFEHAVKNTFHEKACFINVFKISSQTQQEEEILFFEISRLNSFIFSIFIQVVKYLLYSLKAFKIIINLFSKVDSFFRIFFQTGAKILIILVC